MLARGVQGCYVGVGVGLGADVGGSGWAGFEGLAADGGVGETGEEGVEEEGDDAGAGGRVEEVGGFEKEVAEGRGDWGAGLRLEGGRG